MNRRYLTHLLAAALLASAQVLTVSAGERTAATPATTNKTEATLSASKQRYVIPMQSCNIEFIAEKGGRTSAYMGDFPLGSFNHDRYFTNSKDAPNLSIHFSCRPGKAEEVCPKVFNDYHELPPEDIRDTQMRKLDALHSPYYAEVYIATSTGVPTPRSRRLDLCMGDDTHTLVTENGGIVLGYDPREIWQTHGKPVLRSSEAALPDVLDIIQSIRFVPQSGK